MPAGYGLFVFGLKRVRQSWNQKCFMAFQNDLLLSSCNYFIFTRITFRHSYSDKYNLLFSCSDACKNLSDLACLFPYLVIAHISYFFQWTFVELWNEYKIRWILVCVVWIYPIVACDHISTHLCGKFVSTLGRCLYVGWPVVQSISVRMRVDVVRGVSWRHSLRSRGGTAPTREVSREV